MTPDTAYVVWLPLFTGLNLCIIGFDMRQRRVPNRLLLWAFGLQTLWLTTWLLWPARAAGEPPGPALTHWPPALLGTGIALFLLYPLWRYRAMGAGDVKFAACLGFCIGLQGLLQALLLASLMAGAHALAWHATQAFSIRGVLPGGVHVPRSTPYAAYMAFGALLGLGWQLHTGEPWLNGLTR